MIVEVELKFFKYFSSACHYNDDDAVENDDDDVDNDE